jgi:hypothetical protein
MVSEPFGLRVENQGTHYETFPSVSNRTTNFDPSLDNGVVGVFT